MQILHVRNSRKYTVCVVLGATGRSITYSWLLLFSCSGTCFLFFNFSRKWLVEFCCNFADIFSILLLSDYQILNKINILQWNIFALFHLTYLAAGKWRLCRKTDFSSRRFKKASHQADSLQVQNLTFICTSADYSALLSKVIFKFCRFLGILRTFNLRFFLHRLRKAAIRGRWEDFSWESL